MQIRLYIDKAHTALDIFRFAVFFFNKRSSETPEGYCLVYIGGLVGWWGGSQSSFHVKQTTVEDEA